MTTFSDDFNRANTSDLGAGWVEVSGDWSIVSNELSPGAAGGTIILRVAGGMATDDNSAQVTIAATVAASQGVWCRGSSNLSDGYLWRNDGTSWDLFSVVGGSFTSLGTYAAAAAPGDVAKVQAVGSTIKAFVNGVERVSLTNTHVTTGTNVGIRSESASGIRFDDFTAADVTTSVTGSAGATLGGLTAAASGVRTGSGPAAGSFGALTATVSGTPTVTAAAAFNGGSLTGSTAGVRTVIGSAVGEFGALTATGLAPSHIDGSATSTFSALAAAAQGGVPAAPRQGSWYGLLDILREGTQLHREDRDRVPAACLDCGEPLRSGPGGERYCPFDGSIWEAGDRRAGDVAFSVQGRP
jgi:hypothetical protein